MLPGKTTKPTTKELSDALGPAKSLWDELLQELADDLGIDGQDWNSYRRRQDGP